jgi:hypothetical protein
MFSVDNFYNVLQTNLLHPLEIHSWIFYPYGTWNIQPNPKNHSWSISNRFRLSDDLQIIFWDQEPFNVNTYRDIIKNNEFLNISKVRALVHSDICRETEAFPLNWYYFFHGFAALDWFKDAKYLSSLKNKKFTKVFITLNRIVTQERSYRLGLVADLLNRGVVDQGFVSCSTDGWQEEILNPHSKLSEYHKTLVNEHFDQISNNLVLDFKETPGSASAMLGLEQIKLFQSAFVHLVTETIYYSKKLHLTEKIFRPIAVYRPFILAGAAGNLAYLKRYGFQTFSQWWDESYDQETDNEQRLIKIANIVEHLSTLSIADLQDMHQEMLPVLEHNFQHFYGKFKQIIVTEMLDNYTQMLDQYNSKNQLFYDYTTVNIPHLKKHWSQ